MFFIFFHLSVLQNIIHINVISAFYIYVYIRYMWPGEIAFLSVNFYTSIYKRAGYL